MSTKRLCSVALVLVTLVALAGCSLLPGRDSPAGTLEYAGPTEQTVPRGQKMDGSNIEYVGSSPDGAIVSIGGQQAVKKTGDSLNWEGSPVTGVKVALAQRVIHFNDERLLAGGTVQVVIDGVAPAEAQIPDKPLYSYGVPVVYSVRRGGTIPGTTISFVDKTDEGAQLGGVSGYAYRRLADSISWRGRLRPGVYLDVTFRVVAYTDDLLQLTGLATLALTEE